MFDFVFVHTIHLVAFAVALISIPRLLSISFWTLLQTARSEAKKPCAILIVTGGDAMNSLKGLSDKELTGRLRQLVSKEKSLTLLILHTRIIL